MTYISSMLIGCSLQGSRASREAIFVYLCPQLLFLHVLPPKMTYLHFLGSLTRKKISFVICPDKSSKGAMDILASLSGFQINDLICSHGTGKLSMVSSIA